MGIEYAKILVLPGEGYAKDKFQNARVGDIVIEAKTIYMKIRTVSNLDVVGEYYNVVNLRDGRLYYMRSAEIVNIVGSDLCLTSND